MLLQSLTIQILSFSRIILYQKDLHIYDLKVKIGELEKYRFTVVSI